MRKLASALSLVSLVLVCACDDKESPKDKKADIELSAPERAKFAKPGPPAAESYYNGWVASPQMTAAAGGGQRPAPQGDASWDQPGARLPGVQLATYERSGGVSEPVGHRSLGSFGANGLIGEPTVAWQDAPPASEQLGALVFNDGTKKQLSSDDLLWMARAIHGETGGTATDEEAAAMFWTLAQRMRWSPTFRRWTIAKLAQNFSQPINPGWLADGSRCQDNASEACSASRTRLRAQYRALPWTKLSESARRVVVAFAQGRVDNAYVGSVDWLDAGMWRHSGADRRHRPGTAGRCSADANDFSRLTIRGNSYLAVRCPGSALDSWAWNGGEVYVLGADGTRSGVTRRYHDPSPLVASN